MFTQGVVGRRLVLPRGHNVHSPSFSVAPVPSSLAVSLVSSFPARLLVVMFMSSGRPTYAASGHNVHSPSFSTAPVPSSLAVSLVSSFPARQLLVVMFTQSESSVADLLAGWAAFCGTRTISLAVLLLSSF